MTIKNELSVHDLFKFYLMMASSTQVVEECIEKHEDDGDEELLNYHLGQLAAINRLRSVFAGLMEGKTYEESMDEYFYSEDEGDDK